MNNQGYCIDSRAARIAVAVFLVFVLFTHTFSDPSFTAAVSNLEQEAPIVLIANLLLNAFALYTVEKKLHFRDNNGLVMK